MSGRDLILVAYVPVLHEGYRKLFERHRDANQILILGSDLIAESDYLHKEIRALDPQLVWKAVISWGLGPIVAVAAPQYLRELNKRTGRIVMPDEDVCRAVARKYLPDRDISFDPVFLRWDRANTLAEHKPAPDRIISSSKLDLELMGLAVREAEKSSDWWRHVGAIAVRDGVVLIAAHNRHLPSPHTPYTNGDPRNAFFKGVNVELSTALHAEKGVICEAARRGISLEGASLYVSTFPCPSCAKAIVAAGIKRCYYSSGYAVLDGESVLKESGVEIVYVTLV